MYELVINPELKTKTESPSQSSLGTAKDNPQGAKMERYQAIVITTEQPPLEDEKNETVTSATLFDLEKTIKMRVSVGIQLPTSHSKAPQWRY